MERVRYPMGADPLPADLNEYFAKFFSSENTREPGEDIYPEIFDSPVLFPLQRREELRKMMQIARKYSPKIVYEIGADKGGSLYHWCKCLSTVRRVICCEIRGTPYRYLFEQAFSHIDFLWIPESSYADVEVERVKRWLDGDKIDVLFIDGDKSYFHVDFDCYHLMMNLSSVVFMHDIQDESTGNSYQEVISRGYRHTEIVDKSDTEDALERQRQNVPPASVHEEWLRYWYGRSAGVGVVYLDT